MHCLPVPAHAVRQCLLQCPAWTLQHCSRLPAKLPSARYFRHCRVAFPMSPVFLPANAVELKHASSHAGSVLRVDDAPLPPALWPCHGCRQKSSWPQRFFRRHRLTVGYKLKAGEARHSGHLIRARVQLPPSLLGAQTISSMASRLDDQGWQRPEAPLPEPPHLL